MAQRPVLRFASRGWRDMPSPSTRVRGGSDLPYNPGRPISLPGERNNRRRPQFRGDLFTRFLLPLFVLAGMGVGVFFGVSALLDGYPAPVAGGDAAVTTPEGDVAGTEDADSTDVSGTEQTGSSDAAGTTTSAAGDEAAGPIDADQPATGAADDTVDTTPEAGGAAEEAATDTGPTVVTDAQLSGAPTLLERGSATPIPSGITALTLADGSAYNPADETAALSSVWPAGTVLEVTRLPGGPLLTEDDAALLIGKTVQVIVMGNGEFPTELQLSPAAYQLLAREFEPIIALRIAPVSAPE